MVIFHGFPSIVKEAVFTKHPGLLIDDPLIEGPRGDDNLENGTRFVHVGDDAVAHLLLLGLIEFIGIKIRPVGHGQNLTCFGIDQDRRCSRWVKFPEGRIDFILHDGLQSHVDREADIGAVLGQLFLTTVGDDFQPLTVVFDPAESVLASQLVIEGFLDSVDSVAAMIHKTEHMAEHLPIWIAAHRIFLEIKPSKPRFLHRGDHFLCLLLGHLLFDDHIGALGGKLLG